MDIRRLGANQIQPSAETNAASEISNSASQVTPAEQSADELQVGPSVAQWLPEATSKVAPPPLIPTNFSGPGMTDVSSSTGSEVPAPVPQPDEGIQAFLNESGMDIFQFQEMTDQGIQQMSTNFGFDFVQLLQGDPDWANRCNWTVGDLITKAFDQVMKNPTGPPSKDEVIKGLSQYYQSQLNGWQSEQSAGTVDSAFAQKHIDWLNNVLGALNSDDPQNFKDLLHNPPSIINAYNELPLTFAPRPSPPLVTNPDGSMSVAQVVYTADYKPAVHGTDPSSILEKRRQDSILRAASTVDVNTEVPDPGSTKPKINIGSFYRSPDHFLRPGLNEIPTPDAPEPVPQPDEKIWGPVVEFLIEESAKDSTDEDAMFAQLENLDPVNRKGALQALINSGDFDRIMREMWGEGDDTAAHGTEMGQFMAQLMKDADSDPDMIGILSKIIHITGSDPDTVKQFLDSIGGDADLLSKLSDEDLTILGNAIPSSHQVVNVYKAEFLKQGESDHNAAVDGALKFFNTAGNDDGDELLQALAGLDPSEVRDVLVSLENEGRLSEVSGYLVGANVSDGFFTKSTHNFNAMGNLLAELARYAADHQDGSANRILSELLQAADDGSGDFDDDTIRSMVSALGNDAVDVLSKLDVTVLSKMKAILMEGNYEDADKAAVAIIDQALQSRWGI